MHKLVALFTLAFVSACSVGVEPSPFTPEPRTGSFCALSCEPVTEEEFRAGAYPSLSSSFSEVEPVDCVDEGELGTRCTYVEGVTCSECHELATSEMAGCAPRVISPEGTVAHARWVDPNPAVCE